MRHCVGDSVKEWRYFKREEFDCKCGCAKGGMADDFIDKLDNIRHQLGVAMHITSGYRCPRHNNAVSTTGSDGPHTTGRAADVGVSGPAALALVRRATQNGMTGIGINQRGAHAKRFIHMDDLASPDHPRPNIWTY